MITPNYHTHTQELVFQ